MNLQNIVNKYLKSIKFSIKQKTYLFYLQLSEIYISKFKSQLSNLNLNLYVSRLRDNYAYSTVKSIKSLINRSLEFATQEGIIRENIKISVKLTNTQVRKVNALDKSEQNKLTTYILTTKKSYHLGLLLSMLTGLRLGELLALKWCNVDIKNRIIFVEKTIGVISQNHKNLLIEDIPKTQSSIREIPISKQLLLLLKEQKVKSKSEYVVSNYKGEQVNPRAYQKSFENLLKKLNIKHYGFHSLRHTFATRLLEKNVDIKTISELMGHSSPTITLNRYVHTNMQNKRKAMEVFNKN